MHRTCILLVAILLVAPFCQVAPRAEASPGTLRPIEFKNIVGAPGSYSLPYVLEPTESLPDGRIRLAMFDFGPDEQPAGRRIAFGTQSRHVSFGWMDGMVRQITRRVGVSGPYLCDFVEGEDARFVIGVDPPDAVFQVALTLGDPDFVRGPIDVLANGEVVLDDVMTNPAEPIEAVFEVKAEDGWLSFRLRGEKCQAWAVPGAVIYGPPGARLSPLFPNTETRALVPPPDSLTIVKQKDAPEILRKYCQFLLRWAPSDGGFSYGGSWYQNAYPLRTLLAGSLILNEPSYRDTALQVIDRFVAAQKPDGRWISNYFGKPGCHLATNQDTTSSNLADVGSMTLVVALAAPLVDPARRDRYLAAARLYADKVVLPVQRPDGAFPNLMYLGRMYTHPYSVATACQASTLAALGAVTGEARYLDAAERAGLWLAKCIRPDGRIVFSPHDTSMVKIVQPSSFGDVFYIVEALTWAGRYAPRREARLAMRQALRNYFWGDGGLRAVSREGYWWSTRNLWSDSKMGGILYVLARFEEGRSDGETTRMMARGFSWMADAGLSERMGIQAPPASMNGEYGLVATGFAGISVAAWIDPMILLPPLPAPSPSPGKQ